MRNYRPRVVSTDLRVRPTRHALTVEKEGKTLGTPRMVGERGVQGESRENSETPSSKARGKPEVQRERKKSRTEKPLRNLYGKRNP